MEPTTTTPATTTQAQTIVKPEPTSAKLTELKSLRSAIVVKMKNAELSEEQVIELSLELFTNGNDIKTEIANIAKSEREAEIAEKRNARLKLMDDYDAAVLANVAIQADKKATVEEKNAVYDTVKSAREIVTNELLAKYATSTPAKAKSVDGAEPAKRGGTGAEIKELLTGHLQNGVKLSEAKKLVVAMGYSRGTTGTIATNMIEAGEVSDDQK